MDSTIIEDKNSNTQIAVSPPTNRTWVNTTTYYKEIARKRKKSELHAIFVELIIHIGGTFREIFFRTYQSATNDKPLPCNDLR